MAQCGKGDRYVTKYCEVSSRIDAFPLASNCMHLPPAYKSSETSLAFLSPPISTLSELWVRVGIQAVISE